MDWSFSKPADSKKPDGQGEVSIHLVNRLTEVGAVQICLRPSCRMK